MGAVTEVLAATQRVPGGRQSSTQLPELLDHISCLELEDLNNL